MKTICVDACFLIALYDGKDEHHSDATRYFDQYFSTTQNRLIAPWPILYETFSTRMSRRQQLVLALKKDWDILNRQNRLVFLDDKEFREKTVDECIAEAMRAPGQCRHLSLVDRVIRNILSSCNISIDLFMTFNREDFMDVFNSFPS